jgi:hypothetical protein
MVTGRRFLLWVGCGVQWGLSYSFIVVSMIYELAGWHALTRCTIKL